MTNEKMFDANENFSRHISWAAIVAGGLSAIACEIVLALLGMGLGFVTIQPANGGDMKALGVGAVSWWFVSGLVSLYAGGWVAGRGLTGASAGNGLLHGFLTWGLVNVVSALLITTTVGALIGGGFSAVQSYVESGRDLPSLNNMVEGNDNAGVQADERQAPTRQQAEAASKAAGSAALLVFFALVLGACAAVAGSSMALKPAVQGSSTRRVSAQLAH